MITGNVRFELTTNRLTVDGSTAELIAKPLPRIELRSADYKTAASP